MEDRVWKGQTEKESADPATPRPFNRLQSSAAMLFIIVFTPVTSFRRTPHVTHNPTDALVRNRTMVRVSSPRAKSCIVAALFLPKSLSSCYRGAVASSPHLVIPMNDCNAFFVDQPMVGIDSKSSEERVVLVSSTVSTA